jgi:hypothetical protein
MSNNIEDDTWYKLVAPTNEKYESYARQAEILTNDFLKIVDAIIKHEDTVRDPLFLPFCEQSIQTIHSTSNEPFDLKFVMKHKSFILDHLDKVIDLEYSTKLVNSIKNLKIE